MGLKRATQFKLDLTNSSLRAAMFQAIQPEQEPYFGHMVETAVSEQFGLSGAIAFARKNNLKRLAVTSWTKLGVRHVGDIEITYIPTALYAAASTMPLMVDEAGGPSQAHTEIA